MTLTDKIAKFIHESHKELAQLTPGLTLQQLYSQTKNGFVHEYPTGSITFNFTVSVGDMYRPNTICSVDFGRTTVLMSPFERYVVHSISSEKIAHNMVELMQPHKDQPDIKCIILKYDILNSDGDINIEDIKGVLCITHPSSIFAVLENCRFISNVKHLLT